MPFEVEKIYDRRRDIHAEYGGQRQGGISTPASVPFIFLFTGETGHQYGYEDHWDNDGVFLYTGEGQRGDMEFVRGNRAVRDHAGDGKDLLLFRSLGKGKGCRYLGCFACANWEIHEGPDLDRNLRKVIVFHLVPTDVPVEAGPADVEVERVAAGLSLSDLRKRAYEAASAVLGAAGKAAKRTYHERSAAVRGYVLARADGVCEACKKPAPFRRPDGTPYLEPHHIRRLSDGGADDPQWVGAICPNCHRKIHHGAEGKALNSRLRSHVERLEAEDSE
jgi:5-methylcytosine-specific restriction protein A